MWIKWKWSQISTRSVQKSHISFPPIKIVISFQEVSKSKSIAVSDTLLFVAFILSTTICACSSKSLYRYMLDHTLRALHIIMYSLHIISHKFQVVLKRLTELLCLLQKAIVVAPFSSKMEFGNLMLKIGTLMTVAGLRPHRFHVAWSPEQRRIQDLPWGVNLLVCIIFAENCLKNEIKLDCLCVPRVP